MKHRLNMEVDLQSLFGLHVHSCTHWLRPRNLGSYTRALLVSQDRRHLFVTPWNEKRVFKKFIKMFFYQEKNSYRIFPTGACSLYIVVIYSLYNLLREPWNLSF
jgi:hypothetical protein